MRHFKNGKIVCKIFDHRFLSALSIFFLIFQIKFEANRFLVTARFYIKRTFKV
jgi:hypothetical protein